MFVTLVVFLLILSVLVLVHEMGHFLAAKKFGIYVEEFGFGLPPRLFGIKKGETIYSINYLPFGGFVKLYGEEGLEEKTKTKIAKSRVFYTRPVWQRSVVIAAGVFMNLLLAIFIISYIFTQGVMVPTQNVHIEKVITGSPAEIAGIKALDKVEKFIVSENGEKVEVKITSTDILINTTKKYLDREITLEVDRNGKKLLFNIVPRKDYPADQGPMGVLISNFEEKKYSILEAPVMGFKESLVLSRELVKGIGRTLWKLMTFQSVAKDVAGPIGIAQMTGEAIKFGHNAILEMLGLLSLNLSIINILPFPALDGGRLAFVIIEGITGKRVKTNWERYIHQIGMAILLLLILLVTVNDLIRMFGK